MPTCQHNSDRPINEVNASAPTRSLTSNRGRRLEMRRPPTKWFGSDVYTHYTAAYTWESNQMAHAMMGVAGTTLLVHGALRLDLPIWYGLWFLLIPFLKDCADYRVDCHDSGNVFKLTCEHHLELMKDGVTDFFFWATGTSIAIFLASNMTEDNLSTWLAFLVVVLLSLSGYFFVKKPYTEQKRRYDSSGLPFYFRLPSFQGKIQRVYTVKMSEGKVSCQPVRGNVVSEIECFVNGSTTNEQHLILIGPPRSHKTTLASAIGSGLIVRNHNVRYLSWVRLLQEARCHKNETEKAASNFVQLCKANVTIVDDVTDITNTCPAISRLAKRRTVWIFEAKNRRHVKKQIKALRAKLKGSVVVVKLDKSKIEDGYNHDCLAEALSWTTLALAALAGLGSALLILCPAESIIK